MDPIEVSTEPDCGCCLKPTTPTSRVRNGGIVFKPSWWHKTCLSSDRSLKSEAVRKDVAESKATGATVKRHQTAFEDMKSRDKPAWRALVIENAIEESSRRSSEDRSRTSQLIDTVIQRNSVLRERKVKMLRKKKFNQYMKEEDSMSSNEASEEWQRALDNPDIKKEEDDRKRILVPVQGGICYRHSTGVEQRQRLDRARDLTDQRDVGAGIQQLL